MKDIVEQGLDDCILARLESIEALAAAGEDIGNAIADTEKLYKLRLEESRLRNGVEKDAADIAEKKKSRWFTAATTVCGALITALAYGYVMHRADEIEEESYMDKSSMKTTVNRITPIWKK